MFTRDVIRTPIDVDDIIEKSGNSRTVVTLIVLAFFIILFDGFDIATLSYAAPNIIKDWHIESRAALGVALSANLVGALVSAPIFGMIADRYGRKIVILLCCLLMGLSSLAVVMVSSLQPLLVLRFITGLGLGGAAPTLIALTAEFAPARHRAIVITLMYSGISVGGAVAGGLTAWVVPTAGWQILFIVGGVAPLVFGALAFVWMPESLKFLVVRRPESLRARALASRLMGRELPPDAVLVIHEVAEASAKAKPGIWPRELFLGRLVLITPLLWLSKISIQMAFYCTTSWMPTLLGELNVPADEAATATMSFQIGGALGGFILSHLIDRRGLAAVAVFFALGVPGVCSIGFAAHWSNMLLPVTFCAGLCVMGVQYGLNAISAMVYPTALRSYGIGWAVATSRLGAISGPLLGAAALGLGLPTEMALAAGALPLVAGALSSIGLSRVVKAAIGRTAQIQAA